MNLMFDTFLHQNVSMTLYRHANLTMMCVCLCLRAENEMYPRGRLFRVFTLGLLRDSEHSGWTSNYFLRVYV